MLPLTRLYQSEKGSLHPVVDLANLNKLMVMSLVVATQSWIRLDALSVANFVKRN